MMMLGREISLSVELMFWSPGKTGQPKGEQYIGELQTAIEGAHRVARENLKLVQKRMKRDSTFGPKLEPLGPGTISIYHSWL
jgi:hypothetical protein